MSLRYFCLFKKNKSHLLLRRSEARHASVTAGIPFSDPGQLRSRYYRADRLPDVIVGEAPQAHYSSTPLKLLLPCCFSDSLVVSDEVWCVQTGGVSIRLGFLRGDADATQIQG